MGYKQKLQQKFDWLSKLKGGTLQKRRDQLNRAGVHYAVTTAEFRTTVSGKVKRKGSSKIPTGYPSRNSQFGG